MTILSLSLSLLLLLLLLLLLSLSLSQSQSQSQSLLLLLLLLLLLSNSLFVASPEGRRTGCAAVSAEPWMANRERAYSLSGRRIDLGKWKALSFGYFSLGKQRKVTRAPQAIGSLASDSSLL
ncbi:hypothetical protein ACHZ97_16155 [Lysobacter soli]|uniref:hypothetical protein n=1 Tax=Lysobacter soli TaxID=453783 RepID=UPI0037C56213